MRENISLSAEKKQEAPVTLGVQDIKKLIPHRYPMLLVDCVEIVQKSTEGLGIKNVTVNEPYFAGHFPDTPIMPGVLIVEAMAQTAGVIVIHGMDTADQQKMVYFLSIEDARFRKPVLPGDALMLHVTKKQERFNVWRFKGVAKVKNIVHAEATFTAMIANKK
ncbi:MAG: 3-hydroxyacyl-ACP dehydratase FabZ [Alphaproteobacteria bacterium]|nr:MAG: 3-hydroxyacyl-ACP dehydratase FabZ [Alphaproteobacteria bacterium]